MKQLVGQKCQIMINQAKYADKVTRKILPNKTTEAETKKQRIKDIPVWILTLTSTRHFLVLGQKL